MLEYACVPRALALNPRNSPTLMQQFQHKPQLHPDDVPTSIPHARSFNPSARRRALPVRSVSLGASILVHACLLAAAAALVWKVAEPAALGPQTTIAFDAPAMGESPVASPSQHVTPADDRAITIDLTPPSRSSMPDPPRTLVPALEGLSTLIAQGPDRTDGAQSLEPLIGSLGAAGAGSRTDFSTDASALTPQAITFAGLGASNARSVLYVVDASGSMVTSLPFVIAEVERSVGGLSPTQRFGVVLFRRSAGESDASAPSTVEVFAPVLVRATPSARARLHEWLATVHPSGRSAPLLGLERALSYQPDAIFLLSRSIERSGGNAWEFGMSETLARLDTLNPTSATRRPILIQTIQFLDDDPTGIMQEIGRLHGAHAGPDGRTIAGYRLIRRGEDLGGDR